MIGQTTLLEALGFSAGALLLGLITVRFRPDLRPLLPNVADVLDQHGMPRVTGKPTSEPGLYFCGQITVPTGQLRKISIEAKQIAESAKRYLAQNA